MREDMAGAPADGAAADDGRYDAEVFLVMEAAAGYDEAAGEYLKKAVLAEALFRECVFGEPGDGAWRRILRNGPALPAYLEGCREVTGFDG